MTSVSDKRCTERNETSRNGAPAPHGDSRFPTVAPRERGSESVVFAQQCGASRSPMWGGVSGPPVPADPGVPCRERKHGHPDVILNNGNSWKLRTKKEQSKTKPQAETFLENPAPAKMTQKRPRCPREMKRRSEEEKGGGRTSIIGIIVARGSEGRFPPRPGPASLKRSQRLRKERVQHVTSRSFIRG